MGREENEEEDMEEEEDLQCMGKVCKKSTSSKRKVACITCTSHSQIHTDQHKTHAYKYGYIPVFFSDFFTTCNVFDVR